MKQENFDFISLFLIKEVIVVIVVVVAAVVFVLFV